MSQNSDTPSDMFIRTLERTDMPFTSLKMLSRPTRPIIGYTEDKRGIAPHLYRIGQWLRLRLARFDVIPYGERDESDDGYCCGGYYRKRSWKWVDRLADRCRRLAPQPIYDMEWVDPNPPMTKMTWGWASVEPE